MDTQPEALRLADELDALHVAAHHRAERQSAAELRRLHGIEFALRDCEKTLEGMAKKYMDTADQRDRLLEALKSILPYVAADADRDGIDFYKAELAADVAINKAELAADVAIKAVEEQP